MSYINVFYFLFLQDNDQPGVTSSNESPIDGKDVVILTCSENTNDKIESYHWYFNGTKQDNQTGRKFNIGNERKGSGKYTCEVVTSTKTSMKSEEVLINFICKYICYRYSSTCL